MPKCKICGARLKDGMTACSVCGTAVGAALPTASGSSVRAADAPSWTVTDAPVRMADKPVRTELVRTGTTSLSASPATNDCRSMTADDFVELGEQIFEGNPTPIQQREAFRYYQKALAVDDDCARAHMLLGLCYFHGVGTEEDGNMAYKHFSRAHFGNDCDGTAMLGLCYCQGTGVGQNIERGLSYIEDAHQNGSQIALRIIEEIDEMERREEARRKAEYKKMRKEEKARRKAECREHERERREAEEREEAALAAIGAGAFLGGALLGALFG